MAAPEKLSPKVLPMFITLRLLLIFFRRLHFLDDLRVGRTVPIDKPDLAIVRGGDADGMRHLQALSTAPEGHT